MFSCSQCLTFITLFTFTISNKLQCPRACYSRPCAARRRMASADVPPSSCVLPPKMPPLALGSSTLPLPLPSPTRGMGPAAMLRSTCESEGGSLDRSKPALMYSSCGIKLPLGIPKLLLLMLAPQIPAAAAAAVEAALASMARVFFCGHTYKEANRHERAQHLTIKPIRRACRSS